MEPEQEATLKDICETLDLKLPEVGENNAQPAVVLDQPIDMTNWQEAGSIVQPVQPPFALPEQHALRHDSFEHDTMSASDDFPTDNSTTDWPWQMVENDPFLISCLPDFGADGQPLSLLDDNIPFAGSSVFDPLPGLTSGISSDEEPESDLVHEVSARFGALRVSADGQLRYYGAATNYHLLEGSRHDDVVEKSATKKEVLDRIEQAGLDQEIPADLKAHLIDLYFTWHNPSHMNVDRTTFMSTPPGANATAASSGYYSDVLLNAICAIGAAYESRYHPIFVTYPRSLAEYFASRASIFLDTELDCPTIGTVQGLGLLSSHEAARGRDARTWLYGGMAMRLCFDLGLHVDCAPYVKAGLLTDNDARARQSTFWSLAVLNNLSSFHFGRPFRIDSEEITVRLLDQASADDETRSSLVTLEAWTFMCDTMVPLMRKLYGSSSTPLTVLQEISTTVTRRLQDWWQNLPASLQISTERKPPPEVLLLHMTYHHFQILIHRPWTSRRSQPWTGQGPGFRHARRICNNSASSIASLLIQYEKEHSFRRMHSYAINVIFSASLISLFNVIASKAHPPRPDNGVSEAATNLSVCFRALDDLSSSFDSAKRSREHLATIQRKWYMSGIQSPSHAKRAVHNGHVQSRQKRLRT